MCYLYLVRLYKMLIWDFWDLIFYVLRSSKYPYGTIVYLQNGWRCADALNVVLRVLDIEPNAYLFHLKGAYMVGEVFSTDGRVIVKIHRLQHDTLPNSGIRPVRAEMSMIIESLLELKAIMDMPHAKLYTETCFVNKELSTIYTASASNGRGGVV